ncbi:hypothetical protein SDD30_13635 [Moorella naiadis]|uniref:hypothetical protein n=1 Tax=Moorella naiadis (nom. illeg.) TaxID=3093670 RepID=UPI003D9C7EFA
MSELEQESILEAESYLLKLQTATEKIADLFLANKLSEAQGMMALFTEGLDWLFNVTSSLNILQNDGPINEEIQKQLQAINTILSKMMQEMEEENLSCMADHLRYELLPALEAWGLLLGRLKGKIFKQTPAVN